MHATYFLWPDPVRKSRPGQHPNTCGRYRRGTRKWTSVYRLMRSSRTRACMHRDVQRLVLYRPPLPGVSPCASSLVLHGWSQYSVAGQCGWPGPRQHAVCTGLSSPLYGHGSHQPPSRMLMPAQPPLQQYLSSQSFGGVVQAGRLVSVAALSACLASTPTEPPPPPFSLSPSLSSHSQESSHGRRPHRILDQHPALSG